MKKLTTIFLTLIALGLMYFIGHLLNSLGVFNYILDNAIQLVAFYFMGVLTGLIGMFFIPGERADEGAYESAIQDLKFQLMDEENNYRLLQKCNESYATEIQNQAIIISELAEKYSLTQKLYQDCYILLDKQNADEFKKNNLSKVTIGKDGKLS